ncbi:unnamed protein product [Pylaiella littoralis]
MQQAMNLNMILILSGVLGAIALAALGQGALGLAALTE